MALLLTLGPASGTVLDLLDHTKHALAARSFLPRQAYEVTLEALARGGQDGVALVDYSARELVIRSVLHLAGTSDDVLITNWRNIQAMKRRAIAYWKSNRGAPIELRYKFPGATNTMVFDVISLALDATIDEIDLAGHFMFDTPITFTCQPYGRDVSATSLSVGSTANYGTWTPSDIVGDAPPPARARVRNLTGGTYDYIRLAMRSTGTVANFISRYQPGHNAPSGYTIGYVGPRAAQNGDHLHLDVAYAPLLANADFEGSYTTNVSATELVTNGTFPASIAGWDTFGVSNLLWDGTSAMWVTGGDGWSRFTYQNVAVIPGQSYRFSCKMANQDAQQGAGTGVSVTLIGVGVSSTPNPGELPGATSPVYGVNTPGYSKVMVEPQYLGSGYVTHTWDFVAEKSYVQIRFYSTGTGRGSVDDVSLKLIDATASGWTRSGTGLGPGCYQAVDNEGETAGSRVFAGSSAQGFGSGDSSSNNLNHAWTAVSGVTYRVSAQLKRTAGRTGSDGSGGNVGCLVGAGAGFVALVCTSPSLTTYEGSFTATSTTGFARLYCDPATGGIIDNLVITADDDTNNELVRFALPATNIADFLGQFLVYARVKTTAVPFELQVRSGGPSGNRSAQESVTVPAGANYQLVKLGRVNIPDRDLPFGETMAGFSFGVWIVPSGMGTVLTSSSAEIWDVELVPIDEVFWELICPTGQGPAINEYAVLNTQGRRSATYLEDLANNHKASLPNGGAQLQLPIGTVRVFPHVARSLTNDNGSSDSFSVDLSYYGRYDHFR